MTLYRPYTEPAGSNLFRAWGMVNNVWRYIVLFCVGRNFLFSYPRSTLFSRLSENCTKEFYTIDLRLYTLEIIIIIIIINISFSPVTDLFSCHRPFLLSQTFSLLPGNSPETKAIPTAQAASFTLQYFPYNVCCSKCSCLFSECIECFALTASKTLLWNFCYYSGGFSYYWLLS